MLGKRRGSEGGRERKKERKKYERFLLVVGELNTSGGVAIHAIVCPSAFIVAVS
jgi:hypothetical protein